MDISENEVIDLTSSSHNEFLERSTEDCISQLASERAYLEEMNFLIRLNEKQIRDEVNSETPDEYVIEFIKSKIEDFEKQKEKIQNNIAEIEFVMNEKGDAIPNHVPNKSYDNFNYLNDQIATLYSSDIYLEKNHNQNLLFSSNVSCIPDIELGYQYCT
ncbi:MULTISPECIES: hypothetical protein [Providencia]|nr:MULTISPECIES: hypothetical protein [Providencia]MBP6123463.1 hypothetical protein [Providencia sp.]NIH24308.1 hypothetical protein [Providencia heimbachae]